MESANGNSPREIDGARPGDATDDTFPRTTSTTTARKIELEVPLASGVETARLRPRPKTRSPLRDALARLWPWSKRGAIAEDMDAGGVHEITEATNRWFDQEVVALERNARTLAAEWATKGLPRHDVARTAPLEVEQFLAGRCAETFRQWVDRVRVKMRDRIAREAQSLGDRLVELRASTTRIERLESEISGIDSRVQQLRADTKENAAPVGFEPIMPGRLFFWFFAVALTVVEFFANFPVFRLLLPLKPALAKAAEDAAQDAISADWWAGLALQMKEIVLHADALFVALVAVLFLVLFGKTIGASGRVLVALKSSDQPLAATTIRSVRRQHFTALIGSTLGVAAVLTFLYLSRGSIASVAASRVTADSLDLERLKTEARQIPPGDLGAMARSAAAILEQTRTIEIHRDDRAYATTVQNNNTPLFFLNLGLVFGAAILGFLTYRHIVSDGKGEHPAIVNLRADRRSLQAVAHAAVRAGRAAESQARASIGRVEHLMTASPLAEWFAKADRLEVVIPLFRGENARLRNMDPATIVAFAERPALSLPTLEAERGFPAPTDFVRLKEEFVACRGDFDAAVARIPINHSDASSV
ncbi:MAG: hypothetical protein ACREPM_08855 [Gemmatimonadaceae bacterium]